MRKIVIIGGGVAGLSAGIFAQKNGFESVILEKHHTSGADHIREITDSYRKNQRTEEPGVKWTMVTTTRRSTCRLNYRKRYNYAALQKRKNQVQ